MQQFIKYISSASIVGAMMFSAFSVYAENTTTIKPESVRQNIQQMRQKAQERIAAVKNQAKRQAANNIVDQVNRISKVWTKHFMNVLDHLTAVLEKIKTRTQKAADNGNDVTSVNTAIQKATDAIAAAKTVVEAQAQKEYVIDTTSITTPANTAVGQTNLVARLREQFKTLRDQLFQDLTALRDGVMKDARTAVQDALQALKQIPNVDREPAATNQ